MYIYLLRHAIAEGHGEVSDFERALTEEGKEKMQQVGLGMKRLGLIFDEIISSPYIRAWQTAKIAADQLSHRSPIVTCDGLGCGFSMTGLFKFLEQYADRRRLLLVGHEPDMSMLTSFMISGDRDAGIRFKKASLACIEMPSLTHESRGELQWLLGPSQLQQISERKP
jgi:phosphohistidine phosphatase